MALRSKPISGLPVGIDIGATKCLVGFYGGTSSDALRTVRFPTPEKPDALAYAIASVVRESKESKGKRTACGFAGSVDSSGSVAAWPNQPTWVGFPLEQTLNDVLETQITILDDGICAAYAEHSRLAPNVRSEMLCITLGTGIGGAFVLNGEVRGPRQGEARSIGHIRSGIDRRCRCGATGCLQALLDSETIRKIDCGQAADEDVRAVQRSAEMIADQALLFSLDCIVLTGGIVANAPVFVDCFIRSVTNELRGYRCEISVAPDPEHSVLLGALEFASKMEPTLCL